MRKPMNKLIITPRTKIYDLLETYPQLEDKLIDTAPPFKKLKNPVLRNTIARITNLGQAATIGGINVEELINVLRKEVGQDNISEFIEKDNKYNTVKPDWYDDKHIVNTIDIRDMLNKGEQPVHEVLSSIKKLKDGEILEIIAPFLPAPLIDKSVSLNYKHWLNRVSDQKYMVYFINR
jgi:TusA-related sulfurtransferase